MPAESPGPDTLPGSETSLASASAPAIRTRGLSKDFGALRAVDGLSLNIPRAKIYGFLGPNGSGKSTSIRMMCGLMSPSAGSITVLGHEVPREAEALRQKVGYMTQKFSLYEDLTVQENLNFMGSVYALGSTLRRQRVDAVSERYGLGAVLKQRAGTLSGGQKQRLALGCAMLHEPELLFLDEPTSAVDPENRRAFWESLFDLIEEETTILVSTHYMEEAERCHGLAILDKGRLVAEGSPADLSRDIAAQVVLLRSDEPRRAGKALQQHLWVKSVAQIGTQLRVLVSQSQPDAPQAVREVVQSAGYVVQESGLVRASLEDVFVAATLPRVSAS